MEKYKNVDGVSILYEEEKCRIMRKGKLLTLNKCNKLGLRNINVKTGSEIHSNSRLAFRTPATCHHDSKNKTLYCKT